MGPLVLGTRGSRLALVQAESVAANLEAAGVPVEIRTIRTTSEQLPETPLSVIDQRDVFTRQLDEALLAGSVDLAVHSLKDVPTELPEGIEITAVPERHATGDILVSEAGLTVDELPRGAVVATSSLRRRAQLLHHRPDLEIVEIRGNIDTRVRKMREGYSDALVLARAGLERLGVEVPYREIPGDVLLSATSQGALGVAVLGDSPHREALHAALDHAPSALAVTTERAMLRRLEGGCRVPVGALATVGGPAGDEIYLRGAVVAPDGSARYRGERRGQDPLEVGRGLADELLEQGAGRVLDEIREVRS